MKWIAAAFVGWAVGTVVFLFVWAALVAYVAKDAYDKENPRWPAMLAMSIAFMVIALSWAGFFKGVMPVTHDDPYADGP